LGTAFFHPLQRPFPLQQQNDNPALMLCK